MKIKMKNKSFRKERGKDSNKTKLKITDKIKSDSET